MLTTSLLLQHPSGRQDWDYVGIDLATVATAVAWVKLSPTRVQRAVPVLPAIGFLGLAAGALISRQVAGTFAHFYLPTFAFIGLTRPRGTAVLLGGASTAVQHLFAPAHHVDG